MNMTMQVISEKGGEKDVFQRRVVGMSFSVCGYHVGYLNAALGHLKYNPEDFKDMVAAKKVILNLTTGMRRNEGDWL
jgi:hypothetical protein